MVQDEEVVFRKRKRKKKKLKRKRKRKRNIPVHQALAPPSGGGPGSKFDSGLDNTRERVLTRERAPTPPPLLLVVVLLTACFSSSSWLSSSS